MGVRLVQLRSPSGQNHVGIVEGDVLRIVDTYDTVYALAGAAIHEAMPLAQVAAAHASGRTLDYDSIYNLQSDWRLLPGFTHPEPARCLVSGTGLTHKASAENRQAMHAGQEQLTDSMRMYLAGLDGGRPAAGQIGVAPEWFYKGCGTILRAHGDPLLVPAHADDGGEEPEIAGAYIIDGDGRPRRLGMMMANEFSDHVLERKNYLYLAPSKLRTCSVGPELVCGPDFSSVSGSVAIERNGAMVWSQRIATGEAKMSHSVGNLEHHHFKFEAHRRPGDAHIHFFGADAFSFGAGIRLQDGDIMTVAFEGFGRPLRNSVRIETGEQELITANPV